MRDDELPMNPDGANAPDDGSDDLLIRRAARELQAPVAFGADFDARVMAAVRAAAAEDADEQVERDQASYIAPAASVTPRHDRSERRERGVRRAWGWVARPRTLRISPLAGLAAAAALAFVMVQVAKDPLPPKVAGTERRVDPTRDSGVFPVTQVPQVQQVQFVLVAPSAKSVALVGDFNDWNAAAMPLQPVRAGGMWTITVPLAPGRHTYNFVVDGSRVMVDPAAPAAPADDFGTPASVVTVAGAQS